MNKYEQAWSYLKAFTNEFNGIEFELNGKNVEMRDTGADEAVKVIDELVAKTKWHDFQKEKPVDESKSYLVKLKDKTGFVFIIKTDWLGDEYGFGSEYEVLAWQEILEEEQ